MARPVIAALRSALFAKTEPGLTTLFAEYNKYLLRRMSVWLDL